MKQSDKEDKLLALASSGDPDAIEALLDMYKGLVKYKARSFFLAGGDAEDLVQEGMIGLYKAIRDYKPEKGKFAAFAALCVERQISSAIKQSLREKNRPLNYFVSLDGSEGGDALLDTLAGPESENPQSVLEAQEEYKRIKEIIKKGLTKLEREVLNKFLLGQSYNEIAVALGVTAKSVDNAIQRIRRKLNKKEDT